MSCQGSLTTNVFGNYLATTKFSPSKLTPSGQLYITMLCYVDCVCVYAAAFLWVHDASYIASLADSLANNSKLVNNYYRYSYSNVATT